MKKLAVLIVCAAVMASCDSFSGGSKDQLKAENDSLLMELTQRNAELDEMMGTFNDISEGFRQINAAESRVDLQRGAVAEGSLNAKQQIASDIEFIRKQMEENKQQIAKLQSMLKSSKTNSSQLKKAVESLTQELNAKTQRIEELQAENLRKMLLAMSLDLLFYFIQDGGFRCFRFIAGVQFGDNVGFTCHKQLFKYCFGRREGYHCHRVMRFDPFFHRFLQRSDSGWFLRLKI